MDEKSKLLGNFEKILNFFDENSIEKLNFYFLFLFNFIFRKFVTKNRAFENNTIFLQQFFSISGGGERSVFPPGGATVEGANLKDLHVLLQFLLLTPLSQVN